MIKIIVGTQEFLALALTFWFDCLALNSFVPHWKDDFPPSTL